MQVVPEGERAQSDPNPDPTAAASQSTPDRILDAAELHFANRGFSSAAMRDIAASSGLNPASLYNHFSSKQKLYEAVLERGLRPIFELLDSLGSRPWTPENLDAETETLMARLASRPQIPRLIVQEALAGGEHLTRLARDWLRPLYSRALETLKDRRTVANWQEDELPLLLMAFHHLAVGHFAVAPMLHEVFGEDPLSPRAIEVHTRFMRKIVRLLLVARTAAGGNDGASTESD